jgi:RHS repeat-associated protein
LLARTLIEYLIDGSGRRVGRKVNGVVTQKWLYSSDLRIVAELDSANNITSRFVYTSSENVPEYFTKSDTVYRVVTDQLGSVRQIVNTQTGMIVQQIDYDEYGNLLVDTNPSFTPFGFDGGLFDIQTKLVRFGARDYDAAIGRWTTKDPNIFNGGDANIYTYVGNDVINRIDLNGLFLYPWEDAINVTGGTYEQQLAVKSSFQRIFSTARGKELEDMIRGPWYSHGNPVTVEIVGGTQETHTEFDEVNGINKLPGTIYYNPNFLIDIQTAQAVMIAFIDQILGHEIGHATTGTGDTGPGNMDNTNQNENPISIQIGWPARTKYP